MSLSSQLIKLIRRKTVTEADLNRSAVFTLDAIANALAGRRTRQGEMLVQWAAKQGRDAGRTAFVAGALTHILETDDLHRASVTHPGCVVVPAALAITEREKSGGRDLLRAVLHGFEAMCRVGNAGGPTHYRTWHNTATCGPYGSAMTAATLLNLDDCRAMHALGNAGTQSSGVWEFLETGAMSKHLHAGRASEAGIIAADLAAVGFTGPPAILEGERGFFAATCADAIPDAVLADENGAWQLLQTSIKPWPCCRHTHPVIDTAIALHRELRGRKIDSVFVETYQAALDVCDRPQPDSEYEAKFSLFHCAAAALCDGDVDFNSFDGQARNRLESIRQRVSVTANEPWQSAYPNSWGAKVTVIAEDGTSLNAEREGARGDPEFALTDDEMIAKAKKLLGFAGLGKGEAEHVVAGVMGLTGADDHCEVIPSVCALIRAT